jgi:fructose-bisphosphate aldolase class II
VGRVLAEKSGVPTALLLNEVETFEQILRGIEYGFNAVMLDSSDLPFDQNVEITKRVVREAHGAGVDVEAELGHLPMGTMQGDGRSQLTDPGQAAEFVRSTGVDALAVSIGNVHVLLKGKSDNIDLGLLERIHEKVDVPLVIHGSTGFPDDAVPEVIKLGVAKFNVGTVLKKAFWSGLKAGVELTPEDSNPQHVIGTRKNGDILSKARDSMAGEIERLIALYTGRV